MIKKIYVSEIPMIKNKDIEERIDDFVLQQKNGTLVVQDDNEKMMFYPRESTVAEMVEVYTKNSNDSKSSKRVACKEKLL